MKAIRLRIITSPDKSSCYIKQRKYSVYLGNRVSVYFSDKKKAATFLASINEMLNNCLVELMSVKSEIYRSYSDAWFLMPNRSSLPASIENSIHAAQEQLNLCIEKSTGMNASSICFQKMLSAVNYLEECLLLLQKLYRAKSVHGELRRINQLFSRINYVKKQLSDAGKYEQETEVYN